MMSFKEDVVDKVARVTKESIRGVREVCEITKNDRKIILKLEKESEKSFLGGIRRGLNEGVREVMKREIVLALLHDERYEYPPEPVQIICMGEVVGEEVRTKERLEELKKRSNVVLVGDSFVIYKDKLLTLRGMRSELMFFLFPALTIRELEVMPEIYGVVGAMTSTPADVFIKEKISERSIDVSHLKLGTTLVGFNIACP